MEITDYELYVNETKIGEKTGKADHIKHLSLDFAQVEKAEVYLYKGEELYSVLTEYQIKRCFFGHVHGETTGKYDHFERDGIKFSLISCDWLKFCPKLIEKA